MHLLYLCNEYPPFPHGGIGAKYQRIARQLVSLGWQVSVVGVYPVAQMLQENDHGVRVYRLPSVKKRGPASLINAVRINRCLKTINHQNPIELIESQEAGLALISRATPGKKIIRMSGGHNFFSATLGLKPRFWRNLLERWSFAKADALCAVSHYVAETTRTLLDLGSRKVVVLPNPVDTDLFKPQPEIPEEKGMLLFVGTVTEKKGVRQLVQAMPEIIQREPNAHLFIIGRDSVDKNTGSSYTETLKTLIPNGIKNRIHFIGPIPNPEVKDWIARTQVCVYPSHMEAQGIVVIEALACGKAVVASKLGPGPELIEHGVQGLLCDPYDPQDISEQVLSVLSSASLRENLGYAARVKAIQEFSVEQIIIKNIAFYENVIHGAQ